MLINHQTDHALRVSNSNDISPDHRIQPHRRLANLDAIRGFALLGILFLNIYFMANNFYGYAPHQPEIASDIIIEIISNFLLEGRFISLFSMLFGAGLWLQYQKTISLNSKNDHSTNNKVAPKKSSIKRRLYLLIALGAIHGVFLFSGDILLSYGLCGLVVCRYVTLEPKQLLAKSALFMVIAMAVIALISITLEDEQFYRGSDYFIEQLAIWTGSYTDQVVMQAYMIGYMLLIIPISILWYGASLMLIGIALMKQGYFERGFSHKQLGLFACISITFASIDSLLSLSDSAVLKEISGIFMMLGAIPTALVYWHIIVKICQNNPLRLTWLQNIGRLSLSFYILQSVLGIMLLRHWMPQWQMEFDRIDYMLLAIVLGLLQLFLAALYLRFFSQGPLEYLMAKLTKHS
ncbi:DUF418 domain-containing protein [Shewanella sp. OMA3-2]|uniref:DUF418 domain-containing protein n=1 Tax=Shewanella sp. OMA3-2 TaxID=2908650 RepID=UPI001F2DEAAE|nr:DUF418 domain-containing protein [Shewanella sp. OMA3-2]UJF21573.1 DUF418 domain-containing protein [Shewanella sp. OMA3-2]